MFSGHHHGDARSGYNKATKGNLKAFLKVYAEHFEHHPANYLPVEPLEYDYELLQTLKETDGDSYDVI